MLVIITNLHHDSGEQSHVGGGAAEGCSEGGGQHQGYGEGGNDDDHDDDHDNDHDDDHDDDNLDGNVNSVSSSCEERHISAGPAPSDDQATNTSHNKVTTTKKKTKRQQNTKKTPTTIPTVPPGSLRHPHRPDQHHHRHLNETLVPWRHRKATPATWGKRRSLFHQKSPLLMK